MAAGVGSRLSRHFGDIPKCCIQIKSESLINRSVRLLNNYGVNDISVIVGYNKNMTIDALSDHSIKYYDNPFYRKTNSIASLWFAMKELQNSDDDILLLNADLFYEAKMLEEILESENEIELYADSRRKEEADYKLYYKDNILIEYGKNLPIEKITGEYIGIAKLKKDSLPEFSRKITQLIDSGESDMWWEDVLYTMSDEGSDIHVKDLNTYFWAEIDFVEDYNRIIEYVESE